MNVFGQRGSPELVDELRTKAADAVDDELRRMLTDAADTIEAGIRYFGAVESALV